ncbi:hypothetical protein P3T22_002063 [Paraburkholderia sp. GAS348]
MIRTSVVRPAPRCGSALVSAKLAMVSPASTVLTISPNAE